MSALATFRTYLETHSSCDRSDDMLLQLAQEIADEKTERALHVDAEAEADAVFDEAVEQRQGEFYKAWWHKVVDEEKDGTWEAHTDKLTDLVNLLKEGEKARLEMLTANYRISSALKERNKKHKRKREEREAETEARA